MILTESGDDVIKTQLPQVDLERKWENMKTKSGNKIKAEKKNENQFLLVQS